MKYIFTIISCIALHFPEMENSSVIKNNIPDEGKAILVKVSFFPSFHLPVETIFNLNEKYFVFYSPVPHSVDLPQSILSHNSSDEEVREEYQNYLDERPRLVPFKSSLSDNDIVSIQNIVKTFSDSDFSDEVEEPATDGMSVNIAILLSNSKFYQLNPLNVPSQKQRELYQQILNIIISKNINDNNAVILKKLTEYD
ncbi:MULTISPECIES: hypothetical protein [Sphingobacterium]|uniref:DUF4136 domain-containing protein n=1 Tax=Sphingobacterium hotanense TaxID=649196 RepID=A0ABT7NL79_9SPHI|nr:MULTISPECIES: hypothetical protein [Sphingobacterium]MDM1047969.1 hypothetical protein [Sphingobacterium hotanense]